MRSPTPPRYRDGGGRRYRDEIPDRGYALPSRWNDYPPRGGIDDRDDRRGAGWNDRGRGYGDYIRDRDPRDRDRSPPYTRPQSPRPPRASSSRGSPVRAPAASAGRSPTPEEGQITSPAPSNRLPARPRSPPSRARSPPPFRRRSPSPPRYREHPYDRDRRDWTDRSTGRAWSDRREDWRDRDRGGGWSRERDYRYDRPDDRRGFRRSPSPPSRARPRSPSPYSYSSHSPSSHFTSPRKRSPPIKASPRRYESTDREFESPDSRRARSPRLPSPADAGPIRDVKPAPLPVRAPPSGPRGDRLPPTGPRALSGGTFRAAPYLGGPPPVKIERAPTPPPLEEEQPTIKQEKPTIKQEKVTPYQDRPNPHRDSSNPYSDNPSSSRPRPSGSFGTGTRVPWGQRPSGDTAGSSPIDARPEALPPRQDVKPFIKQEPDLAYNGQPVYDQKPTEEELLQRDLATIPNIYGVAEWELRLKEHYDFMQPLADKTDIAMAEARVARASLLDAEADWVASTERRKGAEEALRSAEQWSRDATLGLVGV